MFIPEKARRCINLTPAHSPFFQVNQDVDLTRAIVAVVCRKGARSPLAEEGDGDALTSIALIR